MERTLIFIFFLFAFTSFVYAAAIIPDEGAIDWSNCGIPGNASEPKIISDIKKDFNAAGDGVTDDSIALKDAILAAGGPGVIFIPEGTYLIKSPVIMLKDGLILRGAGADKTKIIFDLNGTNSSCISVIKDQDAEFIKVNTGFEKGSNKLTVDNPQDFIKDGFMEIVQDNDPAVMYTKPEWEQVWAKNVVGQFLKVSDISGNIITTDEKLNTAYKKELNVRVRPVNLIRNCGIESVYLKRADAGDADMISLKYAAYALVKWVESDTVMRSHISVESSYRCEIRDSYFHHAHDYGGGGHGYGVELKHSTSGCLVENNRFFHLRHSMMVHLGANGNVFGYNYSKESFATGDHDVNSAICDISVHGHYPFMNLFESNTVQKIEISDWWGPCGPNTFLRNRIEKEGVRINDKSNGQNLLGNVIIEGDYGIETSGGTDATSILNHGNTEYGETTWDKRIKTQSIPVSLYLKKKPDFLKNTSWPLIGPDCKGRMKLPAELRMNKE